MKDISIKSIESIKADGFSLIIENATGEKQTLPNGLIEIVKENISYPTTAMKSLSTKYSR
ncbi:hypothetical protein CS022_05010 [Veronia nyctiphanis]|uniref:Uncharacterized protein n=1 Tax=Veronia nyctiphanis TaxID=1278244 RepID=A0A4Q0YUZ5_9GAMM|nr:hypothetical protein [Veronia nyctiphanis]RXJ74014.1 hypothetical protein CS022_05010 [Veronia nyctiphanis]